MNRNPVVTMCGLLVVVSAMLATSCSKAPEETAGPGNPAAPETKGRIGMTCMDLTNPFFKLIANVMQEEAAKYGYELVALSGELEGPVHVTLTVYNVLGQAVVTLVDGKLPAGNHEIQWRGLDQQGQAVASGVYLYRLQAGAETMTRKMMLLK